jgi:hypothetical protein
MELGSYFLLLQEQIKDIIIIMNSTCRSLRGQDGCGKGKAAQPGCGVVDRQDGFELLQVLQLLFVLAAGRLA